MNIFTISCFSVAVMLLSVGCSSDCVYRQSFNVPNANWTYEDSIRFEFGISDTSARYNLILELEHSKEYPYQNLYVNFCTRYPSGKSLKQVVSLELAEKAIAWVGKCNSRWCKISIPIQSEAFFPELGKHTIVLEQYMRESPVHGIRRFSLCIQKVGDRK